MSFDLLAPLQTRLPLDERGLEPGKILQYAGSSVERQLQVCIMLPSLPNRRHPRDCTNYFLDSSLGALQPYQSQRHRDASSAGQ